MWVLARCHTPSLKLPQQHLPTVCAVTSQYYCRRHITADWPARLAETGTGSRRQGATARPVWFNRKHTAVGAAVKIKRCETPIYHSQRAATTFLQLPQNSITAVDLLFSPSILQIWENVAVWCYWRLMMSRGWRRWQMIHICFHFSSILFRAEGSVKTLPVATVLTGPWKT